MTATSPYYRRHSLFGPIVILAIGVVALLTNLHVFRGREVFLWFSRFWPLLLILWGLVKFGEYHWARRRNEPYAGIGSGGVIFLFFLIIFGMGATGATHVNWNWVDLDSDPDWGWGIFGTRYDFTESFATPMPTGREVRILSAHGDITITPSQDDQAHVFVHKYVRGNSQDEANQFNAATHPKFEQQGTVWLLDVTGGSFAQGRFNLEIQVPATYSVSLLDRHGDIRVSQMQGDVDLETNHGDITVEQIKGNALLHSHSGDVTAKGISGNVNVDGHADDTTFSDIGGTLTLNGTYTGDLDVSHVAGQVKFTSSRTDLQIAKVDGQLTMDGSDLKANSVAGPFTLRTEAKDIQLDNVSGNVHIDDRRGDIELEPGTPLGNVEVSTTGGEISIKLPETPGFQVDAESDGGEIQSDFSLNINNDRRTATATGSIGKGGPQIKLKTDRGTIQIKKD